MMAPNIEFPINIVNRALRRLVNIISLVYNKNIIRKTLLVKDIRINSILLIRNQN